MRASKRSTRHASKPTTQMAWYSEQHLDEIAAAIAADLPKQIISQKAVLFERSADWYWQARREPDRLSPALTRKKLGQIAGAARKLLRHMGVVSITDAFDGPPDARLIDALVNSGGGTEDDVTRATGRIGRLVEILQAIDAAREIAHRGSKGAMDKDTTLIVTGGHVGDRAVREWIADMMDVYKTATGKLPSYGTSEGDRNARGPFIRFLQAAGAPLNITFSNEQWRNKVRQLRKTRRK